MCIRDRLRASGRRRPPERPEPRETGLAEALETLMIRAATPEAPITDWLLSDDTGKRHRMDLKQYRRTQHEAATDPDTEPGTNLQTRPLISVITPVYNTPIDVLEAAINSVRTQTYENWQLCLVDLSLIHI